MSRPTEAPPAIVSRGNGSPQAEEVRARWAWAERSVWTDRMLTALENGVKGGVWFRLIDKVYAPRNLSAAFAKVRANGGTAGVDHQTIAMFERRLDANLDKLSEQLRRDSYQPRPVRRVYLPKPGSKQTRPLGIPTVRDRVAQAALRHVLEPTFERDFAEHSYGFRPGRGCKDALRRVDALLKSGYGYVVDADLQSYFDTIPHQALMQRIKSKVADGRVLRMIGAYLSQGVMDGLKQWTPQQGSPQGAVLSPLLANIYLDPLDHLMSEAGLEMVRYADDFLILCRSEAQAQEALERLQAWTAQAGLKLHPQKTRIVDAAREGFDFLGYHFCGGQRWPRRQSLRKFRDTIRSKTRRNNGHSLVFIITDVNRILRGWFEYFKHSHRYTFPAVDGWVRMRLRSILRRRAGRRGRGRGADHQHWTNAFFAAHGLFCMTTAHAAVCQSVRR